MILKCLIIKNYLVENLSATIRKILQLYVIDVKINIISNQLNIKKLINKWLIMSLKSSTDSILFK